MDQQKGLLNMLEVLADESRLTMLRCLNEREHAVGDLAGRVELTEPTVSHHHGAAARGRFGDTADGG